MIRVSRDRVSHLARQLVEQLDRSGAVRLLKDREIVRQSVFHVLTEELRQSEEREVEVRRRMQEACGAPPHGSPEWELLFQQLLEEEYEKHVFESL